MPILRRGIDGVGACYASPLWTGDRARQVVCAAGSDCVGWWCCRRRDERLVVIRHLVIDVTDGFYLRVPGIRERGFPDEPLSRRQRPHQGAGKCPSTAHAEHDAADGVEYDVA